MCNVEALATEQRSRRADWRRELIQEAWSVGRPRKPVSGFTLIELLTVISIISVLMGLVLVGLNAGRDRGEEAAVASDLQFVRAAVQQFVDAWGDYPPTLLRDLDQKLAGNGINDGNESLFAFLLTRKRGGPYGEFTEDRWVNADDDRLTEAQLEIVKKNVDWLRGNDLLNEYVDLWGNPYVYIHNRDYGSTFKCQKEDGTIFEVQAQKNPQTGTYYAPTSFQLWSLGVDGENQNGGEDDITSWH